MKIICAGAGPASLYFAISMKRRDAGHDITIIERDPPGATYGWGVVYLDDLLDILYRNDSESARAIRDASTLWQIEEICLRGEETAYLPGYGYSVARSALLDILARRARALGVDVQYGRDIGDLSDFADADLIVAGDGASSRVRQLHGEHFGTRLSTGEAPYIWLGTDKVFKSFTFAFEETPAGWIWFYAYPSSAEISTCIVECSPGTWRGLGLDERNNEDSMRMLEKIFSNALEGHSLISRSRGEPAHWLRFVEVTNKTWYCDNVVLLGDAAHTTHFTLGSGTRLAMIDAVMLAQSVYEHDDLSGALQDFDERGRAALRKIQAAARTSMAWFEQADHYLDRDAVDFAYAMSTRIGSHVPWRYQLHLATQNRVLREIERTVDSGRRWYLARRRGEPLNSSRHS
jgi:anthraniloyl-CoA monooxygenase